MNHTLSIIKNWITNDDVSSSAMFSQIIRIEQIIETNSTDKNKAVPESAFNAKINDNKEIPNSGTNFNKISATLFDWLVTWFILLPYLLEKLF